MTEDSESIATEGIQINWGEIEDKDTGWGFFGGLIRLVTEGYREALYRDWETDRKSTRLNSSHITRSRMPSSA